MEERSLNTIVLQNHTDRSTKRIVRRNSSDTLVGEFESNFSRQCDLPALIEQIDQLMAAGEILKSDSGSCVSRVLLNGYDLVIKRYNHRNLIHSLRHTIKGSRAHRCWRCANRLTSLGIPTPKPFGYIEHRKKGLLWDSYLLTQYVRGRTLSDLQKDSTIDERSKTAIKRQVTELLDELGKHKITHGDLKHTNILITDSGPVLIDLDGMRAYESRWLHRYKKSRDMNRFAKK